MVIKCQNGSPPLIPGAGAGAEILENRAEAEILENRAEAGPGARTRRPEADTQAGEGGEEGGEGGEEGAEEEEEEEEPEEEEQEKKEEEDEEEGERRRKRVSAGTHTFSCSRAAPKRPSGSTRTQGNFPL